MTRSVRPLKSVLHAALCATGLLCATAAFAQPSPSVRDAVTAAQAAGAPGLALEIASPHRADFSALEFARLQHAAIAQRFRWAHDEMRENTEVGRLRALDTALVDGWRLLHSLPETGEFAPLRRQVSNDMIYALSLRGRAASATQLFESLGKPLDAHPPYVLVAAGDAYEFEERLDKAIACYEMALQIAGPGDIDEVTTREHLFYAYLDRGRHEDALANLAAIEQLSPPLVNLAPNPETPNADYETAQRMRAQYLLYTGSTVQGTVAMDALRHDAPFSTGLRNASADARLSDGRPQAARQAYQVALREQPTDTEALIGLARSSLTLRDVRTAREISTGLSERLPESAAVRSLKRDVDVYDSPLLTMEGSASRGPDDGIVAAGKEWSLDTRVYTAPLASDWRLFAHQFTGRAMIDGEARTRVRNGVGVDYRRDRVEASAQVHHASGLGSRTGASGEVRFYPADAWRLQLVADSDSNDLPWRAYWDGVHGWTASGGVRYQPSARRYFDATYRHDDYSDGNLRRTLGLTWFENLYEAPRHAVSAWTSFSTSRNRLTDVPYFSPAHDATAQVTLMYEWRPWRDGRRVFRQRVYGTVGGYRQAGFSTEPLWEVRLEQAWDLTRQTTVTYGVGYGRRSYDGRPENRATAYFSLNVPF